MLVYRGEKRYLAVDLSALLADGDGLTGTPTVEIVSKRGRVAVDLLTEDPDGPVLSGDEVLFWVDVPADTVRGNYLAVVSCATSNGETAIEEAPIIVQ